MKLNIVIILFIGLILRLISADQSFWLDEAITALTASKPFPYQITGISGDFQPPLYYILMHFYMYLPTTSEIILRLPSIFFALMTILVLYLFIKELFDDQTALISSLLLSISQFHIFYSQEMRMYSLLGLLTIIAMRLFYQEKFALLLIVNIIGIYTSYMYVLIFSAQIVWLIYRYWNKWDYWFKYFLVLIFTLISLFPWLPLYLKQFATAKNLIISVPAWKDISSPPFWKLLPQIFLKFSLGRISFNNKLLYEIIFGILLLFYLILFIKLRKKIDRISLYIVNWFVSPLIAGILISFIIPIAGVWRLIFLLPPFLTLVSLSVRNLKYEKIILIVLVLISSVSNLLYYINPKYQREKWREAVEYLESTNYPVVFTVENGYAPHEWYRKVDKKICGPDTIYECLNQRGVYYVSYLEDFFDKNKVIDNRIKLKNFTVTKITDFPGVGFIYFYENRT